MNKKLFAGLLLFGSLWGFSECIIGSFFDNLGLPSGGLMTGFFAVTLLIMSRLLYQQRGMQIGMGLTAGILRLFNPFASCQLCSAIAIMAEGILFEIIWEVFAYRNMKNSLTARISIGIVTAYILFVGGYFITQILTPLVAGYFYLENLIVIIPNILSRGLIAALIGGAVTPIVFMINKPYKYKFVLPDKMYYPITIGLSILCWIFVIGNWVYILAQ